MHYNCIQRTEVINLSKLHVNTVTCNICDFQLCGILSSVHSDEPVQPSFKLKNSK